MVKVTFVYFILLAAIQHDWDMERHPFSIENILKDTRSAGSILKIAPTSEALALAERMAGSSTLYCPLTENFKRVCPDANVFSFKS